MSRKSFYVFISMAAVFSLLSSLLEVSAQSNMRGHIRVYGPDVQQETPVADHVGSPGFNFQDEDGDGICDAFRSIATRSGFNSELGRGGFQRGMMGHRGGMYQRGNGYGRGGYHNSHNGFLPDLEEGQIQLTGTVTDVDNNLFSIINGAFVVDSSNADFQYQPWFGFSDTDQELTIEPGQRVTLIGEFVETEDGPILNASIIRVMDMIHSVLATDEGGVVGVIEFVDHENGEMVVSGIPILYDSETLLREHYNSYLSDAIVLEVGSQVTAHVVLIDSDGDELVDALYAESIMILQP